jgi:MFS family permease
MEFITHATNWIKGELLEAIIITVFSIIMLISAFLFWKFGTTPNSRTLIIQTAIVGVFLLMVGLSMSFSNQKRLVEIETKIGKNTSEFIKFEKKRVEDFQYMYVVSKTIAVVTFVFAFWFSKNGTVQGISIALLIVGISGLIIDYFSEERASIYYTEILNQLQ